MYKKEHERTQTELCDKLGQEIADSFDKAHKETLSAYQQSQEDDQKLQNQIDSIQEDMQSFKYGLLSIQGKQFKSDCRRLLEDNHEITFYEFQELDEDHTIYNNLGGNHNGDHLFNLVKSKFENTCLSKKKDGEPN